MTDQASPGAGPSAADGRFELVPGPQGEPAAVRAAGDIDMANAGQFQAALAQAVAATPGGITADLTGVTYCDSAAIRVLFAAAAQAPLTILVPPDGPITTLLTVAGLDQIAAVRTGG